MSFRLHDLVLITLLLLGCVGLAAWWTIHLQSLDTLSWKSLPPDTPTLPRFDNATASTGNQTLERPLFWESRRPLPPQAATTAAPAPSTTMELLGIVTEDTHRVALLRESKGAPVRRMHQGESINGATIQSIQSDSVILNGSTGLQTLKILRGSQGTPREALISRTSPPKKSADPTPEPAKPALSAEEQTKYGSDEVKKHMENLKRRATEQAQQPATPSQ